MADDTNTAERDAFEKWVVTEFPSIDLTREDDGYYKSLADEWWTAFKAGRASLAASAGSEPVAAGSIDHLKLIMEESAWGGQILLSDALANIDDFVEAHPSPPEGMAGWKDIATAPRDGTPIWLYTASGQCEGYWNYGEWVQDAVYCTYDGAGGPAFQCNPTLWRPLPAPPLPASEAKEL